jgi:steroid delta-isomerase-like uncharacterized protein
VAGENSALIRRWFEEVWNRKRLDAIDELALPNTVGHGQAQHATDIGLKEFRSFVEKFFNAFPDMHVTVDFTIEQGDNVAARWTATMTQEGEFLGIAPTGKKAVVTGTSIQRFSEGKLAEGWDNWDQLALFVQLGAISPVHFVSPAAERRSA